MSSLFLKLEDKIDRMKNKLLKSLVLNFMMTILFLLIFSSCTMGRYLAEQAYGQMKLQWNGKDNRKLLQDPNISENAKRTILLVEKYKKYFFDYFKLKPQPIYSKTTLLENKAVTYLVIASPHDEIRAKQFKFPFMGKFPYIGFFSKDSAYDFAKSLQREQNLVTYIRPVFAYSTLGYLEDRILSSFFQYDDIELANLIFHELFHTVFFIKDEVEVNENLAQFFSKEMLKDYFRNDMKLEKYFENQEKKEIVSQKIVSMVSAFRLLLKDRKMKISDHLADQMTQNFITNTLRPELKKQCLNIKLPIKYCAISDKWNQASMAAYLTYEKEQNFFDELKEKYQFDLRSYLSWLKESYRSYRKRKENVGNFLTYLKSKKEILNAPVVAD